MTLRIHPNEIVKRSSSPLLACHPSWPRAPLSEVADVHNGFAFKSDQFNSEGRGVPLIRIRDVGRDAVQTWYAGDFDKRYLVHAGDLLVGMDGDFRAARWRDGEALLNQRVCRLSLTRRDLMDIRFLAALLPGYLDAVHAHTSAVTVKHLSSRTLLELPLPVPPLREQERIVAAIEEHFSRLDAARFNLAAAQRKITTLRRSLLGSVVPKTAKWVTTADIADVRGGIQKQPKRRPIKNRFPFLRVANVGRNNLDLSDVHEVELFDGELERYRLEPGDLLVVEGNGSQEQIGRSALWRGEIGDCVHQNHLIRVRPYADVDPEYIALYWNTPQTSAGLREVASSTSGLYTLSTAKVKSVPVPLLSLAEQRKIVARAEEQLSLVDSLVSAVEHADAKAESVRRSILNQAFSGVLVSQDLRDQPACTLLSCVAAGDTGATRTPRRKRA